MSEDPVKQTKREVILFIPKENLRGDKHYNGLFGFPGASIERLRIVSAPNEPQPGDKTAVRLLQHEGAIELIDKSLKNHDLEVTVEIEIPQIRRKATSAAFQAIVVAAITSVVNIKAVKSCGSSERPGGAPNCPENLHRRDAAVAEIDAASITVNLQDLQAESNLPAGEHGILSVSLRVGQANCGTLVSNFGLVCHYRLTDCIGSSDSVTFETELSVVDSDRRCLTRGIGWWRRHAGKDEIAHSFRDSMSRTEFASRASIE